MDIVNYGARTFHGAPQKVRKESVDAWCTCLLHHWVIDGGAWTVDTLRGINLGQVAILRICDSAGQEFERVEHGA